MSIPRRKLESQAGTQVPWIQTTFLNLILGAFEVSTQSVITEFEGLWEHSESPPDVFEFLDSHSANADEVLQVLLSDQHFRWRNGQAVPVTEYLGLFHDHPDADALRLELLIEQFGYWEQDHSTSDVDQFLADLDLADGRLPAQLRSQLAAAISVDAPNPDGAGAIDDDRSFPRQIDRYVIEREVGSGSFGQVFLATDTELQRRVAIKLPTRRHVEDKGGAEAFLAEARIAAAIDAPGVVPVYDVGLTGEGACYVVSRYLDGGTLTDLMSKRISRNDAVDLVAKIAKAMHAAHRAGIVHRDIKPANILIDANGDPWITDFGLALRDRDIRARNEFIGTPAWMSPEQARGEGHRVDARSDVYSLGVILYELLTGERPFQATSTRDLLQQIRFGEPRPPRQVNDAIPSVLDRICLKAIARREFDRYGTALDFAEDLQWAQEQLSHPETSSHLPSMERSSRDATWKQSQRQSDSHQHGAVIPRGLRSFSDDDSDFFLDLVPGPRSRDGLPESVDFWARQLSSTDAERSFAVGVVYGPSGCGKSSLFKAGVLPRLKESADVVYVESSAGNTEADLRRQLLNLLPTRTPTSGPGDEDLSQIVSELRRSASDRKVVLCIDQFEQWLHSWDKSEDSELIRVLRQCDCIHVQAVLLVRDDFWMAVTQFMNALGERLIEHQNSGGVDLFDNRHARSVLRKFGRTFGALPVDGELSRDNKAFVEQVVESLAEGGRVIAVRLALFAEIVKNKSWVPGTLEKLGGTVGVGVAFLEETFGPNAPPQQRYYAAAARSVLAALLPDSGSKIRGAARSREFLMNACGFDGKAAEFDEVLRMLDSDLRLITPVDLPQRSSDSTADSPCYQLSHDYLVPALRDWLTSEQRRTLRGRTKLAMQECAADWNQRPESQRLPSLRQYITTRLLVPRREWNTVASDMMKAARSHHSLRALLVIVVAAVCVWGSVEFTGRSQGNALASRLLDARTEEVASILREGQPWQRWLLPRLRALRPDSGDPQTSFRQELHLNLALLESEPDRAAEVVRLLPDVPVDALVPTARMLLPQKDRVVPQLWEAAAAETGSRHLKVAAALAQLDPNSDRWKEIRVQTVNSMLRAEQLQLGFWVQRFEPVGAQLVTPLYKLSLNRSAEEAPKVTAATVMSRYVTDNPRVLTDVAINGSTEQMIAVLPAMRPHADTLVPLAEAVWREEIVEEKEARRLRQYQRMAAAACVLATLDEGFDISQCLVATDNPTVRSYFIKLFGRVPTALPRLLKVITEDGTRNGSNAGVTAAAIQTIGECFRQDAHSANAIAAIERLKELHTHHPDAAVHSSAEWALRISGMQNVGRTKERSDDVPANAQVDNSKNAGTALRLVRPTNDNVSTDVPSAIPAEDGRWFTNGQGQTFAVVVPRPNSELGGAPDDFEKHPKENYREVTIPRTFAIATHEVTKDQFQQFLDANPAVSHPDYRKDLEPDVDGPIYDLPWFLAAHYCNWLSHEEGISESEWCYRPSPKGTYGSGMMAIEDCLSKTGYRMPTPAEWEYACRAGVSTSRHHGEGSDLLPDYAWYIRNAHNSAHRVGRLKPNDYGLFDMLGNASEWSHSFLTGDTLSDADESGKVIPLNQLFFLLGGNIHRIPSVVRVSSRRQKRANAGSLLSGIRLTRTVSKD